MRKALIRGRGRQFNRIDSISGKVNCYVCDLRDCSAVQTHTASAPCKMVDDELPLANEAVLWGKQVVIPEALKDKTIKIGYGHKGRFI